MLAWLLLRLVLSLYLLASALARFDRATLPFWEVGIRLLLAATVLYGNPYVYGPAIAIALLLIGWHYMQNRESDTGAEPTPNAQPQTQRAVAG